MKLCSFQSKSLRREENDRPIHLVLVSPAVLLLLCRNERRLRTTRTRIGRRLSGSNVRRRRRTVQAARERHAESDFESVQPASPLKDPRPMYVINTNSILLTLCFRSGSQNEIMLRHGMHDAARQFAFRTLIQYTKRAPK